MTDILVVGAGLSGATVARLFAEQGNSVTVMDKRKTIGGNLYDYVDKNGVTVQLYGPHIFHTAHKEVFDFLSRFTEWEKYEHRVQAKIRKDKFVPVPFNLTALKELYPKSEAEEIEKILVEEIGTDKKVPILQLKKHDNKKIRDFAEFVYKNIFYIYTMKQWGFPPEMLGEAVMNRVPVYLSYEDRYFTDEYQFMPKNGFTDMIKNMLAHPNIQLSLNCDALKEIALKDGEIYYRGKPFSGTVVYTGCLDELFEFKFGVLPYRSLKFKFSTKNYSSYQPASVVNYTTSKRYTRISEFTKFACSKKDKTVIVKEYPRAFKVNKNIPYYPIPLKENNEHYLKYSKEAESYKKLHLLGRLAEYKYINMDIAVLNAIKLFDSISETTKPSEAEEK